MPFSKNNGTAQSQAVYYQGLPHSVFKKPMTSKTTLFSLVRDEWLQMKDKLNIIYSSYFKYKHSAHVFGFS